jgi:hypothetical protein
VALSYVWGTEGTDSGGEFPRTVKDAVDVTVALGYRFLWVDRYCIEQTSEAKHKQIRQMDLVYQAADVTIIAAAGSNANSGLPGVSDTSRNRQLSVDVNDYTVVHCPETPYFAIPKTTWYTRAWTLQESFLSRRRLVFTSDQVYYECDAMNCWESFIEDRKLLHVKNQACVKRWHHCGIFSGTRGKRGYVDQPGMQRERVETNTWIALRGLTAEYTSRQLSYDCDSFNAFLGIMKRLQTRDPLLCHIWGLQVTGLEHYRPTVRIHLFWEHDWSSGLPSRRKLFPSWAWVGWKGVYQQNGVSHLSRDNLSLELVGGTIVPISHLIDSTNRCLWDTWSQPVALLWKARFVDTDNMVPGSRDNPRQFWLTENRWKTLDLKLSISHDDAHELMSLFRNRTYRLMVGDSQHLLVLEAAGDSYLRIGHADLQIGNYRLERDWRESEVVRII